jgi:hypothetical protein
MLLVLKHQQRCGEFRTNRKRIKLKEWQQVTSSGSNIPLFLFLFVLKNVYTIADKCHFKDAAGHRDEENYDNNFLHQTRPDRAQPVPERKLVQLVIFDRLHFLDLKRENVNFYRRIAQATFCVHVDNSMYHNGLKVAS